MEKKNIAKPAINILDMSDHFCEKVVGLSVNLPSKTIIHTRSTCEFLYPLDREIDLRLAQEVIETGNFSPLSHDIERLATSIAKFIDNKLTPGSESITFYPADTILHTGKESLVAYLWLVVHSDHATLESETSFEVK